MSLTRREARQAQERLQLKNKLHFTVTPIADPKEVKLFNERAAQKSIIKQAEARARTIEAVEQVYGNHVAYREGTFTPPPKAQPQEILKQSMLSRIYNWFLNIKY